MVKRVVVGAHYGLRDWLAQRITAAYMALFTLYFAVRVVMLPEFSQQHWHALFSGGFMAFATFLFALSLFYHAWVGMRDIIMDYVNSAALRLTLHSIVFFALLGQAGWAAQILWRLAA